MEKRPKLVLGMLALALMSCTGWFACFSGDTGHVGVGPGKGGASGAGTGGTGDTAGMGGSGNSTGMGGAAGGTTDGGGMGGTGGAATGGSGGGAGTGGAGAGGAGGAGGTSPPAPINVLIWNTALVYGHAARVNAIQYLKAREASSGITFDTTYAHLPAEFPNGAQDGPSDTRFDASVFTDQGLDKYDVVFFLDTTGNTIDDSMRDVRRQALQDFIEKKGRGFVGTHSATDTYQNNAWAWYVDFIGANFNTHSNAGTPGTASYYQNMTHPILTAAAITNPWNRSEEWYTFTRDPLASAIPGIKILLTCHDNMLTQERDITWVHEMPLMAGAPRAGRLFYTAFGHATSAFQEPKVMDMIIAGIKWVAYRL